METYYRSDAPAALARVEGCRNTIVYSIRIFVTAAQWKILLCRYSVCTYKTTQSLRQSPEMEDSSSPATLVHTSTQILAQLLQHRSPGQPTAYGIRLRFKARQCDRRSATGGTPKTVQRQPLCMMQGGMHRGTFRNRVGHPSSRLITCAQPTH